MKKSNKAERRAARKSRHQQRKDQELEQKHPAAPLAIEWRTEAQAKAWKKLQAQPITFLLGAAGSGKTFLAMAYAIEEVLQKRRSSIVLTRPIVEAGERLGYLPGTFGEKVNPYMQPLYDAMDTLLGRHSPRREIVNKAIVLAPLCYMRGRTFNDAICIFDEAQNASYAQLKLFLSRFGHNSQIVITGDPAQSDLPYSPPPLTDVITKLRNLTGIGVMQFESGDVVRHPLVAEILKKL